MRKIACDLVRVTVQQQFEKLKKNKYIYIKENPPNSKLLNKQAPFKRGKHILVLVSVTTFGFPWYCINMETSDTAQQQLYAASFILTKILTRDSLLFPFCQSKL